MVTLLVPAIITIPSGSNSGTGKSLRLSSDTPSGQEYLSIRRTGRVNSDGLGLRHPPQAMAQTKSQEIFLNTVEWETLDNMKWTLPCVSPSGTGETFSPISGCGVWFIGCSAGWVRRRKTPCERVEGIFFPGTSQ